jgi:hypothetical protein
LAIRKVYPASRKRLAGILASSLTSSTANTTWKPMTRPATLSRRRPSRCSLAREKGP